MQAPDYRHTEVGSLTGTKRIVGLIAVFAMFLGAGYCVGRQAEHRIVEDHTPVEHTSPASPLFVELDCIQSMRRREAWEAPPQVWQVIEVGRANYLLTPMPIVPKGYKWGPTGYTSAFIMIDPYMKKVKCGKRTRRGKRR